MANRGGYHVTIQFGNGAALANRCTTRTHTKATTSVVMLWDVDIYYNLNTKHFIIDQ